MRIDAAATQPVFGGLCHQLIVLRDASNNDRSSGREVGAADRAE